MSVKNTAVPYVKTPEGKERAWDAGAAEGRLRSWAGVDGQQPSAAAWDKYREGFSWYDSANAETLGAYKLPHHDVEGGELVLSREGLGAAAQRLDGTEMPDDERAQVRAHLEHHYHDLGLKAPWEAENRAPKVMNLGIARGADGSKHLDLQIHGVIDGGWLDDAGVDTSEMIAELQKHLDAKTIGARINSVGGSAFGGVAMYNALKAHPAKVTTYVEGLAASAASLVAMAGDEVVMGRGSMMMIHSPSTVAMGNADELRKTADTLDKVQDALAGIYTAKTGKSTDEVNQLLDDETWMTADEAVDMGFADRVGMPEEEPDADDPQMVGDAAIAFRGVTFPSASVPQQIMAMAKPTDDRRAAIASAITEKIAAAVGVPVKYIDPTDAVVEPAPILALVPAPEPQPPITRAELALRSPDLLAALLDEGRAAGVAAERARLKEIDDLGIKGAGELVAAAKYGEQPTDAAALALAVVKAGQFAGHELLAQRRAESRALAAVSAAAIDNVTNPEAQAVALMVAAATAHRGGKGK